MLKTIRIPMMVLILVLMVFLPKVSYAWGDQQDSHRHGHGDGHGYRHHSHANPDLVLVTGMDDIDSRVLVDPAPDPVIEVEDQPAPEVTANAPVINSDVEGNFIINVPNNAGGYTPIRIQKSGNGYIGPQGELYYPFPQVSQLKAMYGI